MTLGCPCWFQEKSLSVKKIHLNRSCTSEKKWFLFLFLSACPSHPGLPNTCLWWKNINRIARVFSINCCLTAPAKHCKVVWFFLFIFVTCSLPHIQRASAAPQVVPSLVEDLHVFALSWSESQSCSPELIWIQSWGLSLPTLSCYPQTEEEDTTESQIRPQLEGPHISMYQYHPVVMLLSVAFGQD